MRIYLSALAVSACTWSPNNGQTFAGSPVGKAIPINGYTNHPNEIIHIDVLKDTKNNPAIDANWQQLTTALSSSSGQTFKNDGDEEPLYEWRATIVPVPTVASIARWPDGGLVRLRAWRTDDNGTKRIMTTFDNVTIGKCAGDTLVAGGGWVEIGQNCVGTGGNVTTLVSTDNVPRPQDGFLHKKGVSSTAETTAYYAAIGAPATLAAFKLTYGFPINEVNALYYNDGDLGVGREMHCKKFLEALVQPGVVCYVSNYSSDGTAKFDEGPAKLDAVFAHAIPHNGAFATVAMVYTPFLPNEVAFMAYDGAGNRVTEAALDNTGVAGSIPKACMTCHGIESNLANNVVSKAKFLPFDPFSYKFSTMPGYTLASQQNNFRALNALVKLTNPTPATIEWINGMYAPKQVTDPTAIAHDDFIPAGWSGGLDEIAIYNGVVKIGCRSCHVSAGTAANRDFNSLSDFNALAPAIRSDVCGSTHLMPQAERVMKRFWESGGRAYLTSQFPPANYPDDTQACQ